PRDCGTASIPAPLQRALPAAIIENRLMDNRWLILAPGLATAISLVPGLWLGYTMQGRRLTAAFAAAPLLLPPTLIGAWFLLPWFTLPVAVLAGSVFGIPFLLLSSCIAFQRLDPGFLN